jgi:hypothetical protein
VDQNVLRETARIRQRTSIEEFGAVKAASGPYALPPSLERDLAHVRAFWDGLKRHEAELPLWGEGRIGMLLVAYAFA